MDRSRTVHRCDVFLQSSHQGYFLRIVGSPIRAIAFPFKRYFAMKICAALDQFADGRNPDRSNLATRALSVRWIPHFGCGCPQPEGDRPAVRFRSGVEYDSGRTEARYWRDYTDRDLWTWAEGSDDMHDIIAYQPTAAVARRAREESAR
jgi:hypothetical protein